MTEKQERVLALARAQGVIRPSDLKQVGATSSQLRGLVASGTITRSARGLYRLSDHEFTESHSLVEAVRKQSKGVVCLLSALSFHEIGTQLPYQVWLAVPYGTRIAKSNGVPLRVVVATSPGYEAGIESHLIEGVDVAVYSIAKTVADCFKFRNKIGLDVALEALREVLRERRCNRDELRQYAKTNRVENIMRPYMEAMSI